MIPVAIPTGPVPPKTSALQSFSSLPCFVLSSFSTQATRDAAVVKAPLGSAKTETSNGGTMACRQASNISTAKPKSRPPINIPVRLIPAGDLEKITS